MTPSELLSALCLIIVVLFPMSLMFLAFLSQVRSEKRTLSLILLKEMTRSQTFLNLIAAKDFQVFAGLQAYTQNVEGNSAQKMPSTNSASEYIPRDDITEAMRLQQLADEFGVGVQLFQDDPETAAMLVGMRDAGQISFGEE